MNESNTDITNTVSIAEDALLHKLFDLGHEYRLLAIPCETRWALFTEALSALRKHVENEIQSLVFKRDIGDSLRLFDLVRYMRSELHQAELIDDDEYAWLCAFRWPGDSDEGSPSPRRLEGYDAIRKERDELRALLAARKEGAHEEAARIIARHGPRSEDTKRLPLVLYQGWDVYQHLTDDQKRRTSPENVSDTLDAVVKAHKAMRGEAGK